MYNKRKVLVTQWCPNYCNPMECSPPAFSIRGIFQARILDWVAVSFYKGSSRLRDQIQVSRIVGKLFTVWPTSSVQFIHSVVSDSLQPHWLHHARLPCPSPTPRAYSNSCPSSRWYHPTISSSVIPFSSCFQSFPTSGSFQMSQFFTLGGQSIGVSASSVLPVNTQDLFPLGSTGWISLLSKGL